jgi:hypothetical protein
VEERSRSLCEHARRLAVEQALPLEVLDSEVLLDNQHAIIQYLGWDEFDPRPFVSRLSTQFEVQIALQDLAPPPAAHAEELGCGKPGCGKTAEGGCSSCGTGGGCSSCGSAKAEDLQPYFAELREKMGRASRKPLL